MTATVAQSLPVEAAPAERRAGTSPDWMIVAGGRRNPSASALAGSMPPACRSHSNSRSTAFSRASTLSE